LVNEQRIVIIGCGAGGGTAAQLARKTDRNAKITILEMSKYAQYSKCGLPYVISEKIKKFENLIEFSKEWFEKEKINLYLNTEVTEVNIKEKKITFKKDNKLEYTEFDKLILATGAESNIPPIKNIQINNKLTQGVYCLRTLEEGKILYSALKNVKKVVIIGAGLIGLETADVLYQKGLNVTIVEALPNILENTLDSDMSNSILNEIESKINVYTNHFATEIELKNEKIENIHIKNNETNKEFKIETDLIVVATGSKPDVTIAEKIGCKIGKKGGITVNEKSETSVKDVYAAGDCTEYKDFITKQSTLIGLGSIAVRQGIAAGINAAGGNYALHEGLLQTRTSEFFGYEVAAVGPVKKEISNFPIVYGKFSGSSLISYFPGGKPIVMKIGVNENTGEIISAQSVGANAALRINVFACAIQNKVHVEDMRKMETAYAPPIAPTLDAITLVCDVAYLKYSRKNR